MASILSPEDAQEMILHLFASLPSKQRSRLLDDLKAMIDSEKGWEIDCESGIEVEIIDGIDQDDFYSHRHDRDDDELPILRALRLDEEEDDLQLAEAERKASYPNDYKDI